MTVVDPAVGIILVAAGITLLGLELVHPGALLLIPGSILIAAPGIAGWRRESARAFSGIVLTA